MAITSFLVLPALAKVGAEYQMALGNPSLAISAPAERTNYLISRDQYALSYNDDTHQANWVSWSFTSVDDGSASRTDAWAVESALPAGYLRIGTSSFGTGWDRGHMCPSGDRTISTADNEFTFRMSNMIPQASSNNQGLWATFESYCRGLAADGSEILVTSGPSSFGGTTISNGMWIPGSVWKVAVKVPGGTGTAAERINTDCRVIALVTPNTNTGLGSWQSYITSVEQIEENTGLRFFSDVSAPVAIYLKNLVDTGTGPNTPTVISSFSPASGAAGTSVGISGYNFGSNPAVRFNGSLSPSVTVVNPNLLSVTVPTGATSGDITVTGAGGTDTSSNPFTILSGALPSLNLSISSLGGFSSMEGSPGGSQSYAVSGSNLTGDITLTSSGPFEISSDNQNFASSLILQPASGLLASVPVHVRLAAGAPLGAASGGIIHIGGGASSQSLALSGSVGSNSPTLTLSTTSLNGFTALPGNPGVSKSYTVSGANLTGNITVTAHAGFELSLDDLTYTPALELSPSNGSLSGIAVHVRIQSTSAVGSLAGSIGHAGGGAAAQSLAVSGSVSAPSGNAVSLATWETTGLSGYGPSPFIPASSNGNVSIVGLTRGTGITLTGTAAGNAWGGSGMDGTAALADAVTRGDFTTFAITPNPGVQISFTQIPAYNIRHSSSGPTSGQWQYQIGAGSFVNIGGVITWGSVTTSAGNAQPQIDLTVYPELRNVASGITVTFRLVAFGASSSGGTFYINNITGSDFSILGTLGSSVTTTPVITSAVNASGTAFEPFFYQITATNQPTSFSASGLPTGLSLDSQTGVISGTPTVTGSFSVGLTASKGDGDGTATLALTVVPNPGAPVINSLLAAEGRMRSPFIYQISASNSPTALLASNLPPGLQVDGSTGNITGVPTATGTYEVAITAQNPLGGDSRTLVVTVLDPLISPSLTGLQPFASAYGSASSSRIYQLEGTALGGAVTLLATEGFELSVDGGAFSSSATITPLNGTISASIAVRLMASAPLGEVTGSIIHSGGGAIPKYVELAGTVSAPVPTLALSAASLEAFNTLVDVPSIVQSYTISGVNLSGVVGVSAPAGFEISHDGSVFSNSLILQPVNGLIPAAAIHVRLAASPTAASFGGAILHSGGGAGDAVLTVSGTVTAPVGPVITSSTSGSVYVGSSFNHAITVEGSPTMVGYAAEGLPAGLTINTSTGVISGSTSTAATSVIDLFATSTEGTSHGTYTLRSVSSAEQSAILPSVVINKFLNAAVDQVELLVTGDSLNGPPVDLRGMILKDFNANMGSDLGGRRVFNPSPLWSSVKAGTLVVLSTGQTAAEDLDPSDFVLRVNLGNTDLFTVAGGGFDISNTDMVMLKPAGFGTDGVAGGIHALAAGSAGSQYSQFTGRKIRSSRQLSNQQGSYAYVINNQSTLGDFYLNSGAATARSLTFGSGNNTANTTYINNLRGLDQTAPVLTLAGSDPLSIPHLGSFTDPGATAEDAVDGTRPVTVTGTVDPYVLGSYFLTYSASDIAGNVTSVTRAVWVTDQTPPLITVTGAASLTIAAGSAFTDPGAVAVDAVNGLLPVTVDGTVDGGIPGVYMLTYHATDTSGNSSSATRQVTVTDQSPPIMSLIGEPALRIQLGQSFVDPGADAVDAVDGILPVEATGSVNRFVAGIYPLAYTATDAAGNTSVPVERTVTVVSEFEFAMTDQHGLTGGDALSGSDPDHDGFTNLQEFAFGLDPTTPGGQLVRSEIRDGMLRIRFLSRSGVNYSVESTTDLGIWVPGIPTSPSAEQPGGIPAEYTEYQAALPVDQARRFLRVAVSLP